MRKENAESLDAVIKRMLKVYKLNDGYIAAALEEHYRKLMGPLFAQQLSKFYFKDGRLSMHFKSPAVKQEMLMGKEQLVRRLNEAFGDDVIKEITIH